MATRGGSVDFEAARVKPAYQIGDEDVAEPSLTEADQADLVLGARRFNRGEFWESHEAWERVWRRHAEPSRIFFQGLIRLAAAYHQLGRGVYHGVRKHFNNAELKLKPFPDVFLGVEVRPLLTAIQQGHAEVDRLGPNALSQFDRWLIPRLALRHAEDLSPVDPHAGSDEDSEPGRTRESGPGF